MSDKPKFEDTTPVRVAFDTDRGALAALIDNPLMLSPDVEGSWFANAVRRGVRQLRIASAVERTPLVTVSVSKSRLSDHEADQEAWEVTLAGDRGDTTFAAYTDEELARAHGKALAEALSIVLGDDEVDYEA